MTKPRKGIFFGWYMVALGLVCYGFGVSPGYYSWGFYAPEMIDVFQRQRVELDAEVRREIIREGQILNAESMYLVPTQAGAGTIWTAYQPEVQGGIRSTLGYGAGAEEYAWYWLAS